MTRFWPEMWTHNFYALSKRNNQVRFAHFESLIKTNAVDSVPHFPKREKNAMRKKSPEKPVNANDCFITLHKTGLYGHLDLFLENNIW